MSYQYFLSSKYTHSLNIINILLKNIDSNFPHLHLNKFSPINQTVFNILLYIRSNLNTIVWFSYKKLKIYMFNQIFKTKQYQKRY